MSDPKDYLFELFVLTLVVLGVLAFEIWMFVDAIRNPRLRDIEKVLWCLGMLVIYPFVGVVYFLIARSSLRKSKG